MSGVSYVRMDKERVRFAVTRLRGLSNLENSSVCPAVEAYLTNIMTRVDGCYVVYDNTGRQKSYGGGCGLTWPVSDNMDEFPADDLVMEITRLQSELKSPIRYLIINLSLRTAATPTHRNIIVVNLIDDIITLLEPNVSDGCPDGLVAQYRKINAFFVDVFSRVYSRQMKPGRYWTNFGLCFTQEILAEEVYEPLRIMAIKSSCVLYSNIMCWFLLLGDNDMTEILSRSICYIAENIRDGYKDAVVKQCLTSVELYELAGESYDFNPYFCPV